jgi:hypothetical protein
MAPAPSASMILEFVTLSSMIKSPPEVASSVPELSTVLPVEMVSGVLALALTVPPVNEGEASAADHAARLSHTLRHRQDRQRQMALQEPRMTPARHSLPAETGSTSLSAANSVVVP